MNSSIQRIWIGTSGRSNPASVAIRMKPRNATWVEIRKTRPFWTLSTIRRPSPRPYMSVANESSPRTRSAASWRNRRPAAHRDGDVGPVERRRVVDTVAGHRDGPSRLAGEPDEALLLVRRRPGDHLERRQLALPGVRRSSVASSAPATIALASSPAAAAIAAAVPDGRR